MRHHPPSPRLFLAAAAFALLGNAEPVPIPRTLAAMLDAAMASGNDADVATIAKYTSTAAPDAAPAIAAVVAGWRQQRAAAAPAQAAVAGTAHPWKGQAVLGGYVTTGNTRDIGASAAIDLTRETDRWRHKFHAAADYQQSAGVVSRDHFIASYEPNFKFSPRGYVYGAAQYEADHYLGYDNRYSASLGAGYSAIKHAGLTLDAELGPAFRHTDYVDQMPESAVSARGKIDFDWKLTGAISLSQDTSAYLERANSTVASTTALNAKLFGPLAAQLSYAVQYESAPPSGSVGTDTTSRASLVYSF